MQMHIDFYSIVILFATLIAAVTTNISIARLLAFKRWNLCNDGRGGVLVASTVSTVVLTVTISLWSNMFGGNLYMLAFCFAGMILNGFIWAFVVGGLKILERVLLGLSKTMDAVPAASPPATA